MLKRLIDSGFRLSTRWVLGLALGILATGCGSGSDGPTSPTSGNLDQVEKGLTDLVRFGQQVADEEGAQVLVSQPVLDIVGTLPLDLGPLPPISKAFPGLSRHLEHELGKLVPNTSRPRVQIQQDYGTYDRDPADTTEPFPGWMLVTAGDPVDGYLFRFFLDDDIDYIDEDGNEIPLRGEIRFLDIVIDDAGNSDPVDDILTQVVFEIAATPLAAGPIPTLVRINPVLTLDEMRNAASLQIGDENANSPSDPNAAYIGHSFFFMSLAAPGSDATIVAQVFDSTENFSLRFEVTATNIDPATDVPETLDVTFGFGETTDPASPPWSIYALFSNFQPPEMPENADVTGDIRFEETVLATFVGDTTEVPVDLDGNPQTQETCINVDITFTDDPENPRNICEALSELAGDVGTPALKAMRSLSY